MRNRRLQSVSFVWLFSNYGVFQSKHPLHTTTQPVVTEQNGATRSSAGKQGPAEPDKANSIWNLEFGICIFPRCQPWTTQILSLGRSGQSGIISYNVDSLDSLVWRLVGMRRNRAGL